MKKIIQSPLLLLFGILALALILRLIGLNWDDYARLHPDERFINGISSEIGKSDMLTQAALARCEDEARQRAYFDTACSVYNPNNIDEGNYSYGTLPLFMVHGVAQGLNRLTPDTDWTRYDYVHLVGRAVNAFGDTLAVLLIYLMGWRLFSARHGLLAAAFYALAVFPIQQAHFWTVDSLSHLFFMLGLYAAIEISLKGRAIWYLIFGLAYGAALASRVNLFPMAILLPLAVMVYLWNLRGLYPAYQRHFAQLPPILQQPIAWGWLRRAALAVILCFIAAFLAILTFRVGQPYAFMGPSLSLDPATWMINPVWVDQVSEVAIKSAQYEVGWVPSQQWVGRIPYFYPWWNMAVWGMGAALGLIGTLGLAFAIYKQALHWRVSPYLILLNLAIIGLAAWFGQFRLGLIAALTLPLAAYWHYGAHKIAPHLVIFTVWVAAFFGYQGGIHLMTMRYYLPLYATLCILAAWLLLHLRGRAQKRAVGLILLLTLIWAGAFTAIYRQDHTRLAASQWIVETLPGTITLESSDGARLSANISPSEFRANLMTAYRGESYLGELFELSPSMRLDSLLILFTDSQPATFNLRLIAQDDLEAANPIISLNIPIGNDGRGQMSLDTDEFRFLEPAIYRWHVDSIWESEAELRYLMPILIWYDTRDEDAPRHTVLSFLTPFQDLPYLALDVDLAREFSIRQPFEAQYIYFPHQLGYAESLSLTFEEENIIARRVESPRRDDLRGLAGASARYRLERPIRFERGNVASLRAAAPIFVNGTVIANEGAWDDALPWSYCDYSGAPPQPWYLPFQMGEHCRGVNAYAFGHFVEFPLNMVEQDNRNKYRRLTAMLQLSDYLVLSSNRFYDAIPRALESENQSRPRYPLSISYYDQLFGGDLRYALEREFSAFPRLGFLTLPDQVLPTSGAPSWMNELEAEEAFTVYDHPTVFVYQNQGFTPADFEPVFVSVDERNRINLSDYSPSFRIHDGLRSSPLLWLFALWLLGWLSYPLMYRLLAVLPLRGFALGRGVAWLSLALIAWWLTSVTGGLFWSRSALIGFSAAWLALNAYLFWRYGREIRAYLRLHWRAFLNYELLFVVLLGFGLLLRLVNPDLWHAARGGEKPMDFAYLNAVLRTDSFPPPNPWLAGFEINYYYFGFVVAALPIKLLGYLPEYGTNLVLASLYAIVGLNLFSLAYALLGALKLPPPPRLRAIFAFLGLLFIMLMGNLGTLKLMIAGDGSRPRIDPDRWYWYPTRIIGEAAAERGSFDSAINEIPLFSFLWGDLHAHLIGLLPVSLFLAALFMLYQSRRLVWGFVLGLLAAVIYMSNTWDMLLYIPLAGAVMWFTVLQPRRFIALGILAVVGGVIAVAPYYLRFTLGDNSGFERWDGERSPLGPFLLVWGIPIMITALWLLYRLKARLTPQTNTPVEVGILILVGALLLAVDPFTATTLLCLIFIGVGLALGITDIKRELRPLHLGLALIYALLLFTEWVVVRGDVGRQNTVFKITFQLWVWLGLLIPLLIYSMLRLRLYWQSALALLMIALGLLFPLRAIPARMDDNELGRMGLDGNAFMESMTLGDPDSGALLIVGEDAPLIDFMRREIEGYPVIAEWYSREYWWNSRIAVQTGLPSLVGWMNHLRQQYSPHVPEIERRRSDLFRLYTSDDRAEIESILRGYNIAYIIMGALEQANSTESARLIYNELLTDGALEIVYSGAGGEVYAVHLD